MTFKGYVNEITCLSSTFWGQGYLKQLEIKRQQIFCTHWNFLLILSNMFLHLIVFICIFIFFTILLNSHASTLEKGISAGAGPDREPSYI